MPPLRTWFRKHPPFLCASGQKGVRTVGRCAIEGVLVVCRCKRESFKCSRLFARNYSSWEPARGLGRRDGQLTSTGSILPRARYLLFTALMNWGWSLSKLQVLHTRPVCKSEPSYYTIPCLLFSHGIRDPASMPVIWDPTIGGSLVVSTSDTATPPLFTARSRAGPVPGLSGWILSTSQPWESNLHGLKASCRIPPWHGQHE